MCKWFVVLTKVFPPKVRSAAIRVGTRAFCTIAHPRLKHLRTTFLIPRLCTSCEKQAVQIKLCAIVSKQKAFIRRLPASWMFSMGSRRVLIFSSGGFLINSESAMQQTKPSSSPFQTACFRTFCFERAQCFAGPRQMEFHLEQLHCRCCICGRKRGAGRQHQLVS